MKVLYFKSIVKKACKIYTFNKLISVKNGHEKNKHIEYTKLETSQYLLSCMFSVNQSKLLFKLRTRMLDVKANFKNKFQDNISLLMCNLCDNQKVEDQKHVIECTKIENNKTNNVTYLDLFNKNLNVVKNAIDKYEKSWKEMCKLKSQNIAENNSPSFAN